MPRASHSLARGPIPSHAVSVMLARALSMALFLALFPALGQGQSPSNLRLRYLAMHEDSVVLDSLSIVPGSLHLFANGLPIGALAYTLDPYRATVHWLQPPTADSILARYRVLPIAFAQVHQHKDPDRLTTLSGDRKDPFRYEPPRQNEDPFGVQGLNKSGSISRGVLFGNNQDLAVNSTLNLELSGRLSDRIQVLASVTDNNIPIQAGGNTLELQDFDQVFIKLFEGDERDGWSLIAGDFVLQRPKSHFLTYLKKTKGLSFDTPIAYGEKVKARIGASAAISKGKFARNVIQGIEGVQGPYRLRGTEAGAIIVILSGTERVFIDGQVLLRGQENDYVIDYNTAEITFTAKRSITKDRRITVEFQYSDKNYARSLVRLEHTVQWPKNTLRFNLYSEQDHRNQPLQQELGDVERNALRLAGDDPFAATVAGADSTGHADDQVLYFRTDSLGYSPVYRYSTHPDSALWRVTFTQTGPGTGDYVQQEFTPNGRVFRWVAPDTVNGTIVHRGDHAPVRVLVAPRAHQFLTIALEHAPNTRTKATVELAYSNEDRNTFSDLGDADDQGLGLVARGEHAIGISAKDSTLQLLFDAETEAITSDLRYVERYRAVEFDRNWNIIGLQLNGDQLLAASHVKLRGKGFGSLSLGASTFQVDEGYSGWKQEVASEIRIRRTDVIGTASRLTTDVRHSDFLRHKALAQHRFKMLTVGYKDEHERNLFRPDGSRSMTLGSYQFHEWEAFVQSPDTFKNKWRLAAGQRWDKALRDSLLVESARATSYGLSVDLARDPRKRLATTFTYRRLEVPDTTLSLQRPENTYLARIDHDLTTLKGMAVLDLFYELGSGLEQRREYIYVSVPAGQGLYIWNDYNGNGIKELNEFELANFGYEADHLRVFVPSNDYVRSFSNQFSTSLDLRPAVRWGDAKGFKRWVARFSDLASIRIDRKTAAANVTDALNPLVDESRDTSLTSYSSSIRNTFFYDRTSRTWSVDHTLQRDQSRSLLVNGFESRSRHFDTFRVRWNTTRQWTTDVEAELGRVSNGSDLLTGRTYRVEQEGLKPRVTWQPNTSIRAIAAFKYTDKQNAPEYGGERALIEDLGLEFRYNTAGKGSILITANRVAIRYTGVANSAIGNELLVGLKPGTNLTWSVGIQRNLSNNLQVDITYNGRSSQGVPMVHVGGAQVRAFF
ncbi:MAG: hypothetical protein IT225_09635 [Flavobacteriales bacterium]|jgi:hypothetical protein|nr:hypothetical protein [Flavobacteriales bacterium]